MKYLFIVTAVLCFVGCSDSSTNDSGDESNNSETNTEVVVSQTTDKEEIKNANKYHKKFYPASQQVQIEGQYDENGKRHGIWKYYSLEGKMTSMTEYLHGKKEGMSIVYYPSGQMNYRGEYKNDKPVGVWITYDPKTGEKATEKDYGSGE